MQQFIDCLTLQFHENVEVARFCLLIQLRIVIENELRDCEMRDLFRSGEKLNPHRFRTAK